MDNRVRYFYLRDQHRQPVACVASIYFKKDKRVNYGISVRNPLDHFDRKVARELAAGRLALYGTPLDLSEEPIINCHVIARRILSDLLAVDQLTAKQLSQIEQDKQDQLTDEIVSLDQMIKKIERQKRELVIKRNQLQNHLQELQGYDKIPARAKKSAKRWLRKDKEIAAQISGAKKAVIISGGSLASFKEVEHAPEV